MSANDRPESGLPEDRGVVLFDGVCNLCNGAVTFVIEHDRDSYFRFASLQSGTGTAFLRGRTEELPDSIVLVEAGRIYTRSEAALRIARRLDGAYPLLYALIVVPRWIRDRVYDWVARNRYRWFGKREACMIPTPELRERFLE
jgi:predicted DCC family thiol-disulfide oxidoreductase YuxK